MTQKRQPTGPTHCKHPTDIGICAAYVAAGSPHPHVCNQHAKENR